MPKFNSITVAELRDLLAGEDDDAVVAFVSDYGDRSHTQQVHALRGEAEMRALRESAYSSSGWALEDEENEGDDTAPHVIILS